MSLLDLLTRVSEFGMPLPDIWSSVLKDLMATKTPSIQLLSHQTEKILSLVVWIKLSRCGSLLHQEVDTPTQVPRGDDASEPLKVTK